MMIIGDFEEKKSLPPATSNKKIGIDLGQYL